MRKCISLILCVLMITSMANFSAIVNAVSSIDLSFISELTADTEETTAATESSSVVVTESSVADNSEETAETTKATEKTTEEVVEKVADDGLVDKKILGYFNGYTVEVSGMLPQVATLSLTSVKNETAQKLVSAKYSKGVSVFACDIKIIDGDSKEWQPTSNPVKVTVTGIEEEDDVEFLHISDDVDDVLSENDPSSLIQKISSVEKGDNGELSFETDSFSTFVGFTVEFAYEDKVYTLNGKESVMLSEIFSYLGIHYDTADISSVEFSDDTLVSVKKQGDDYLVASKDLFTSVEKLTIVFNDDAIIEIKVTDYTSTPTVTIGDSQETKTAGGLTFTPHATYSDTNPATIDSYTISGTIDANAHLTVNVAGNIKYTSTSSLVVPSGTKLTMKNAYTEDVYVFRGALSTSATNHVIKVQAGGALDLQGSEGKRLIFDGRAPSDTPQLVSAVTSTITAQRGRMINIEGATAADDIASDISFKYVNVQNQTSGNSSTLANGSGVLIQGYHNSVKFENTKFLTLRDNNSSNGGGAAVKFASTFIADNVSFTDCEFDNCRTYNKAVTCGGGAVKFDGSSKVNNDIKFTDTIFNNCYVYNNDSSDSPKASGGAIEMKANAGSFEVNGCSFVDCKSTRHRGGAISLSDSNSTAVTVGKVSVIDSEFTRCTAAGVGGAITMLAGVSVTGDIEFKGLTFTGCTGSWGGGFHSANEIKVGGNWNIEDNDFISCTATGGGGAFVLGSTTTGSVNFTKSNTFKDCSAPVGGAIYVGTVTVGGGLTIDGSAGTTGPEEVIHFDNCDATGTASGNGGGVLYIDSTANFTGGFSFVNNSVKGSEAKEGGVLDIQCKFGGDFSINDNVIDNCKAKNGVAGAVCIGAASKVPGKLDMMRNTFSNITASTTGAILYINCPIGNGFTFNDNDVSNVTSSDIANVYLNESATVTGDVYFLRNTFTNCKAKEASAMYLKPKITGSLYLNNGTYTTCEATGGGAGLFAVGGASSIPGTLQVCQNTINGAVASASSSVFYINGPVGNGVTINDNVATGLNAKSDIGGFRFNTAATVTGDFDFKRNSFTDCNAKEGSVLFLANTITGNLSINEGNVFTNCHATNGAGGAICANSSNKVENGTIDVSNNIFNNTSATTRGGALYFNTSSVINFYIKNNKFNTSSAGTDGGVLAISTSCGIKADLIISHNEFNNTSSSVDGGALYVANVHSTGSSATYIKNNLFNVCTAKGGYGGALVVTSATDRKIYKLCIGNDATEGATDDDNETVSNIFYHCNGKSGSYGGALRVQIPSSDKTAALTIDDFQFNRNYIEGTGSASESGGGAGFCVNGEAIFNNKVFRMNENRFVNLTSASKGAGIHMPATLGSALQVCEMDNNAFLDCHVTANKSRGAGISFSGKINVAEFKIQYDDRFSLYNKDDVYFGTNEKINYTAAFKNCSTIETYANQETNMNGSGIYDDEAPAGGGICFDHSNSATKFVLHIKPGVFDKLNVFENCRSFSSGAIGFTADNTAIPFKTIWIDYGEELYADEAKTQVRIDDGENDGDARHEVVPMGKDGKPRTGVTFKDCYARAEGGITYFHTSCNNMVMDGIIANGCQASDGSAFKFFSQTQYYTMADSYITNCAAVDLVKYDVNGGTFRTTGAVSGNFVIQNTTFKENYSWWSGGALYWIGGGAKVDGKNPNMLVKDCMMDGNEAAYCGGAIYNESVMNISNTVIKNNTAYTTGGGIKTTPYSSSGSSWNPKAINITLGAGCELVNNEAGLFGGGLCMEFRYTGNVAYNRVRSDNKTKNLQMSFTMNDVFTADDTHSDFSNYNVGDTIPDELLPRVEGNAAGIHGGGVYFGTGRSNEYAKGYDSYYTTTKSSSSFSISSPSADVSAAQKQQTINSITKYINIKAGVIANNEAGYDGGGIYSNVDRTSVNISNGAIYGNTAGVSNRVMNFIADNKIAGKVTYNYHPYESDPDYKLGGISQKPENPITGANGYFYRRPMRLDPAVTGYGGAICVKGTSATCNITGGYIGKVNPDAETDNDEYKFANMADFGGAVAVKEATLNITSPYHMEGDSAKISALFTAYGITAPSSIDSVESVNGVFTVNDAMTQISVNSSYTGNNTTDTIVVTSGDTAYQFEVTTATAAEGNISNNYSYGGGGLFTMSSGVVNIKNGHVKYNEADNTAFDDIKVSSAEGVLIEEVLPNKREEAISERNDTVLATYVKGSGGGIYAHIGQVNLTGGNVNNNSAFGGAGGGVFANDGGKVVMNGGMLFENTAKTVGETSGNTTFNEAVLNGVGGAIALGNGTANTAAGRSGFTLTETAGVKLAIYNNIADFAADDVYASGQYTDLAVPNSADMDIPNPNNIKQTVAWFEDFHDEDPEFSNAKSNSSVPVQQSQSLSGIFNKFDIQYTLEDVASVTSSDTSKVTVARDGTDWTITSLEPFSMEGSIVVNIEKEVTENDKTTIITDTLNFNVSDYKILAVQRYRNNKIKVRIPDVDVATISGRKATNATDTYVCMTLGIIEAGGLKIGKTVTTDTNKNYNKFYDEWYQFTITLGGEYSGGATEIPDFEGVYKMTDGLIEGNGIRVGDEFCEIVSVPDKAGVGKEYVFRIKNGYYARFDALGNYTVSENISDMQTGYVIGTKYRLKKSDNESYGAPVEGIITSSFAVSDSATKEVEFINKLKTIEFDIKYYDRKIEQGKPSDINDKESVAVSYVIGKDIGEQITYGSYNLAMYAVNNASHRIPDNMLDEYSMYDESTVTRCNQYGVAISGTKWLQWYNNDTSVSDVSSSNIDKITNCTLWLKNNLKEFTVKYYSLDTTTPLNGTMTTTTVGGKTYYVPKTAIGSMKAYFNQRTGIATGLEQPDKETDHLAAHGKPAYTGKEITSEVNITYSGKKLVFSHWSLESDGKIIATTDYKYAHRITKNTNVYAVYTEDLNEERGLTVSANTPDEFTVDGVDKIRLNTMVNAYNFADGDGNRLFKNLAGIYVIPEAGVEIKSGNVGALQNWILDELNRKTSSTNVANDAKYSLQITAEDVKNYEDKDKGYSLKGLKGANFVIYKDVTYTDKNRVNMTVEFKRETVVDKRMLAFAAINYEINSAGDTFWRISDNCIEYTFDSNGSIQHTVDETGAKTYTGIKSIHEP